MSETETHDRDEQVLTLRQEGRSFGKIARLLDFKTAKDVIVSYRRAIDERPAEERSGLREAELTRLDQLATVIQAKEGLSKEDVAKRLSSIERLRALLAAS